MVVIVVEAALEMVEEKLPWFATQPARGQRWAVGEWAGGA